MLVANIYIYAKVHHFNASFEPVRDFKVTPSRIVQDPEATRILEALLGARQFGFSVIDEDGENTMDDTTSVSIVETHEIIQYLIQI
ncbi:hypothetical protein PG990_014434 [Apiospora arundinis]|uniref:Uncharacterized protein n=1 Tax=Apiospora arundinis TaxID=335852 RepID=A0ABR2I7K7_9PEZI